MPKPTCKICKFENIFPTRKEYSDWAANKRQCKKCDTAYCDKPETERKLFTYQDIYLENRGVDQRKSDYALNNLYKLVKIYSESLFHKKFKASTHDTEILENNKDSIALTLLEKYLSKEDFKIMGSFWGYMYHIAKWVLYDTKELPLSVQAEKEGYELFSMNYEYEDSQTLQVADAYAENIYWDSENSMDTIILYNHFSYLFSLILQRFEERNNFYIGFCVLLCVNYIMSNNGDRSILMIFNDPLIQDYVSRTMKAIKEHTYLHIK